MGRRGSYRQWTVGSTRAEVTRLLVSPRFLIFHSPSLCPVLLSDHPYYSLFAFQPSLLARRSFHPPRLQPRPVTIFLRTNAPSKSTPLPPRLSLSLLPKLSNLPNDPLRSLPSRLLLLDSSLVEKQLPLPSLSLNRNPSLESSSRRGRTSVPPLSRSEESSDQLPRSPGRSSSLLFPLEPSKSSRRSSRRRGTRRSN